MTRHHHNPSIALVSKFHHHFHEQVLSFLFPFLHLNAFIKVILAGIWCKSYIILFTVFYTIFYFSDQIVFLSVSFVYKSKNHFPEKFEVFKDLLKQGYDSFFFEISHSLDILGSDVSFDKWERRRIISSTKFFFYLNLISGKSKFRKLNWKIHFKQLKLQIFFLWMCKLNLFMLINCRNTFLSSRYSPYKMFSSGNPGTSRRERFGRQVSVGIS